ncbi:efflux RND transporter periplasmic adaptor subunit [Phocaeicola sartorii]|uniref:efflux RND transporter periplasmic adaptor subunit n=1 Tax=Phocaeicola sartorii TaxID=671267 RepID=UPI001362D156|nr:efflux RND transporter periplasmic adaptor subunit [Phocaeicola sartorii]NBH68394.1 efflux RND transporter periplasmic adaptor subunit [Phocaeicola sartorii]
MSKSILSLVALALIATISSCKKQVEEAHHAPLVKTTTATVNNLSENHNYPGIVKPQDDLSISFRINGQIESLLDKSGTEVRKGDLLAKLDSHDYEVNMKAALAAYQQSDNEFNRIKQLYASKTISPNDFEKAEAAHKVVLSKYQAAKDALEYTNIRAPFDGYIQNIYHQKGEIVQAGMPVISFISKNTLKVEVFLPFRDFERIDSLTGSWLEINGKHINLELGSISQQANAAQLYKAEFIIQPKDAAEHKIVAGKNCQVRLTFSSPDIEKTVSIPLSAIMNSNNEASVWVLEKQNIAKKVNIKIRNIDHDKVTVSGINEGQQVVISGIHSIKEGETVSIMSAPSKTNIGGML